MNKNLVIATAIGFVLGLGAPYVVRFITREEFKTFATYKGGSIKGSDVLEGLKPFYESQERQFYRMKRRKTEEILRERLGANKLQDIKPEDLDKVELPQTEVDEFIKNRYRGGRKATPEDLKQLTNNLKMRKLRQDLEAKNKALLEEAGVVYTIPNAPEGEEQNPSSSAHPR